MPFHLTQLFHLVFAFCSIEINEWNKFDDKIGLPDLGDGVQHEDFVGAQKEMSKFDTKLFDFDKSKLFC